MDIFLSLLLISWSQRSHMMLDPTPHQLTWVEVGGVRRQKEQRTPRLLDFAPQCKATQRNSVDIRSSSDFLIVLKIDKEGASEEIYNGSGNIVWDLFKGKKIPKNGQHQVRISRLRNLMINVAQTDKIKRIRP